MNARPNTWASRAVAKYPDAADVLADAPDLMCPTIDDALHSTSRYPLTKISKYRPDHDDRGPFYSTDDFDALRSEADDILAEREHMQEALEECRAAIDALRSLLLNAAGELCDLRTAGGAK